MNKKVCKNEIGILFVLYLIILKYLIRKQESTFSLYLLYLITSFNTQKEIKSQGTDKKTPDNVKKDFGICGKVPINKSKTANLRSGNYYYNARWYDPNLGRFITEDPIRNGVNWFIYANNSPLVFTDPTGLGVIGKIFRILTNQTITNLGGDPQSLGQTYSVPKSQFLKQFHTENQQKEGYRKLLTKVGVIPHPLFEGIAILASIMPGSDIDPSVVTYKDRKKLLTGAEQAGA